MLEDYSVLLLCPLTIEHRAAILMLDEIHDKLPPRSIGQTVLYTLGKICSHNVAIAGYPAGEVGMGVSGSMVLEALRDFPSLEIGILVGVAAGIPSPTRDIRLGDVAVAVPDKDSPGIIGYDLKKVEDTEIELKQWQNSSHPLLRSAIKQIQARAGLIGLGFTRHLPDTEKAGEFRRPGLPPSGGEFLPGSGSIRERDDPVVHYGNILSGNTVIKSKAFRDELRDRYGGIAIEMEAAGMTTRLPVAVVRGISDFADFMKSKEWQPYASLTAAAYAKEILSIIPPLRQHTAASSNVFADIEFRLAQVRPERTHFEGRKNELDKLTELVGLERVQPKQKSVVALWGLSGVGKSQLASEFVDLQRSKHKDCEIFWINGESKEACENSIEHMLRAGHEPTQTRLDTAKDSSEPRTGLVTFFFDELQSEKHLPWLLIIDSVSKSVTSQQLPEPGANAFDVHRYVRNLKCGAIVLISARKEFVEGYPRLMEIKGLDMEDAVTLLKKEIDPRFTEDEDLQELADMLRGLPLLLRLATSSISRYHITVADYIENWKKRGTSREMLGTSETHLRSFEVSFEELGSLGPLTVKLLMLFSFLDHRDMWYELCLNANEPGYPDWLRRISDPHNILEHMDLLADFSFVEVKPHRERKYIYEIHPAIHVFSRRKAAGNEEEYMKCVVSLVAAMVPRSTDNNSRQIAQRLEPHALQCLIHMRQGKWGQDSDITKLAKFANLFRMMGRHDDAQKHYEMVLGALRTTDPSPSSIEFTIDTCDNLGLVYYAQGHYSRALKVFEFSFARRQRISEQDQDSLMGNLYNAGLSLLMLGELDEAQQRFLRAAEYFSKDTSDSGLMIETRKHLYFRILNDLGEIYIRQGAFEQARRTLMTAFDGLRLYLETPHPDILAIKLNYARIYVKEKRFTEARIYFEDIIATYKDWWGECHPETMRAVFELADLYMEHGKLKSTMENSDRSGAAELQIAEELWNKVLAFYQEMYGVHCDMAAITITKLASLKQPGPSDNPFNAGHFSGTKMLKRR